MFFATIAFLGGDLFLHSLSTLPSLYICYLALAISCALLFFEKYSSIYILCAAFGIGFSYSALYASNVLSWSLPKNLEGKPIELIGEVASIPIMNHGKIQFDFKTKNILLRLMWQTPKKKIIVGDQWLLYARLKRIHSSQNKGTFDFEAFSYEKKIRAKGAIIENDHTQLLSHHWYHFFITHLRQKLLQKIEKILPQTPTAKWLVALIVGERNNISQEAWGVLRNTGTNHLMVIAGLHIGMMASFTHWLFTRARHLFAGFSLRLPLNMLSAITALIVAFYYSMQAGFSLPTKRAIAMLALGVLVLYRRKTTCPWHIWSGALLFVVILNPASILSDSFWLSFATIALIIYGMHGRLQVSGIWWEWGRVQWVIALGLVPLSLALYQECSMISVLVNSLAIPWLGLFILPFCIAASFCLPFSSILGQFFLNIADLSLKLLWMILHWFATLNFAVVHLAMPNISILILTTIAMILFLLPTGVAGRWFGVFLLLPLFFSKEIAPTGSEYWVTILDVGQGLSVVVKTAKHTLLFDAGPKIGESMDAGKDIVTPYLRSQNIHLLDTVMISHKDNDHRGGIDAVKGAFKINQVITSVPNELSFKQSKRCVAGDNWQWDDVKFLILHPAQTEVGFGNDSSCVLLIDNGKKRVLLTADIEEWAERKILERNNGQLGADILIAPHHGSKTSSSPAFVRAVHPRYVVFPIGYLNHYHFPHDKTLKIYSDLHIRQLDSVTGGAIKFKLSKNNPIIIESYRKINKHFWLD